jgi:hypothetical protein
VIVRGIIYYMGQRANLILVQSGEYQLFYSHWCANTLTRDLFWGPDHAMAFIRIQRAVDDSGWLDDIWAEGGAVVDLDHKHFLLYGGEDLLYDVPRRRIYLNLLAKVWNGWTVHWAYEGIAELADYVGYPRDRVLSKRDRDYTDANPTPPDQKDWTDLVASVRLENGTIRLYPLAGDVESYLYFGPRLVDNLRVVDGLPRLLLDEWTTEFPRGGFHLDLSTKRVEFWIAPDAPDIGNRVAGAWPEWETRWCLDHYEMQIEQARGLLRFPLPDRRALLDECREMLLVETTTSPTDTIKMLTERDRAQGKNVEVNPWALRDDRLVLPRAARMAILDKAMSGV